MQSTASGFSSKRAILDFRETKMKKKFFAIGLAGCAACSTALAQQGTRDGEWHYWGGDAGSTRYAPLAQIDKSNAKNLEVAWRWAALPIGDRPDVNWQATPLMIDGVLYVTTGVHQAAAIDPASGKTIWVFAPIPKYLPTGRPGNPSGRSMAYWTDGNSKRLFRST